MQDTAKYADMAIIMKALAHPTRLLILDRLNEREHCVCELQEIIGADMSTVSKHLSVMKHAGIVAGTKRNNQIFYRLLTPCVMDMYRCVSGITHGG